MPIKVLEFHHHAVSMPTGLVEKMGDFYRDILGFSSDAGRWVIPGIPGYFFDVPNDIQIHLLGSDGQSPYSQGFGRDPVENHMALAVEDVVEAERFLTENKIDFFKLENVAAPQLQQLFLRDPAGHLIELHQIGHCRCKASDRPAPGAGPKEAPGTSPAAA
ncbi:MAG TPA: VOC family protein [Caulobacteraceae bacterium]|nr:VOC family protein [Caulobacteraceae bacterium]